MAGDPPIKQAISIDIGDDSLAADHPVTLDLHPKVAPSFESDKTRNTIKDFLIVVGCNSLPDARFEFDNSFVLPEAKANFIKLHAQRERLAEPAGEPDPDTIKGEKPPNLPPLSIFGHADPVGKDTYNSALSQRRALAVYAVLIRKVSIWEEQMVLWPASSKQTMIDTVDAADPTQSGTAAKLPRRTLIEKYMDLICVRKDATGAEIPFKLEAKADFLARGADPNAKGDVQGCGEFNPALIMSKAQSDELDAANDKETRDKINAVNRRVVMFLFKPGSRMTPKSWPCPHARDPNAPAVCKKRFWSDGEERRKPDQRPRPADPADVENQPKTREFKKTRDTFACRFYHGIAENSPCEGVVRQWAFRVLLESPRSDPKPQPHDVDPRPLSKRRFVVKMGDADDAPRIRGRTDEDGVIRLPVFDEKTKMDLRLQLGLLLNPDGTPQQEDDSKKTPEELEKDEESFRKVTLDAGALEDSDDPDKPTRDKGALQRLFNLGYGPSDFPSWTKADADEAVRQFQVRNDVGGKNGVMDKDTRAKLKRIHDTVKPPSKEKQSTPAEQQSSGQ